MYLENLRLSINHFPLKRRVQLIRTHDHRTIRQLGLVVLGQTLNEILGALALADGSGGEVEKVVAVVADLSVVGGDTLVGPGFAEDGVELASDVGFCDGAVDVGNYDFVGVVPKVDSALDAGAV